MTESYFAGAYWLGRSETAEQCAQRAAAFFQFLGRIEPTWNRWCETAESFEEAAQKQVATDVGSLREHFSRKDRRLGDAFRYWLWAGTRPEETSKVSGMCGSADPWTPSSCVLSPPEQGPLAERLLTATMLSQVVRELVLIWEPEFGLATSSDHLISISSRPKMGTLPGWVMYFSRQRGTVPPLPAPVRVEPVGDLGTLVVLTPDRFTVTNPEHVALASGVQQVLDAAGLLHPLLSLS
ncbi:immunity 52 family protein [Corallococcus carmarthensis]|uniref:Immunity protein 52 domain-containing protein n=1 Tax=Corallococcus carmarthensis TaxID=2316728 RepID=A0A3A8JVQ6_9BACT|nr:immunity 52 family protein [Corallococcus carmarthensis]NOK21189.1 hypothetical protein [Corallococcus carmarthensis]RKG95880.1 hypothetical protein D7X32_37710 [Corallococcus carmarthensis]